MKPSDAKKLKDIRGRVSDLRRRHSEAIERHEFAHLTLDVVPEMEFLLRLIDRAQGAVEEEEPEAALAE